ncbi:hypothetical protein BU17DRAFT_66271 [Hysterangium stoloniferum]|nr:hypothetical protein BU17DRAFT_66271 [Hysterangium stoloniferum]
MVAFHLTVSYLLLLALPCFVSCTDAEGGDHPVIVRTPVPPPYSVRLFKSDLMTDPEKRPLLRSEHGLHPERLLPSGYHVLKGDYCVAKSSKFSPIEKSEKKWLGERNFQNRVPKHTYFYSWAAKESDRYKATTSPRKGMVAWWYTAAGGPGTSGKPVATEQGPSYDALLRTDYDFVSFHVRDETYDPLNRVNLISQQREADSLYKTEFDVCAPTMGDNTDAGSWSEGHRRYWMPQSVHEPPPVKAHGQLLNPHSSKILFFWPQGKMWQRTAMRFNTKSINAVVVKRDLLPKHRSKLVTVKMVSEMRTIYTIKAKKVHCHSWLGLSS